LVLPALLLRAIIPPGFMPAAGQESAFRMAMCPGHASLPPAAPSSPVRTPETPGKHHEVPCVFAAASGASLLPHVAAVAAVIEADEVRDLFQVAPPPARPTARANTPRAPPVGA
jgi:hypothetical protein